MLNARWPRLYTRPMRNTLRAGICALAVVGGLLVAAGSAAQTPVGTATTAGTLTATTTPTTPTTPTTAAPSGTAPATNTVAPGSPTTVPTATPPPPTPWPPPSDFSLEQTVNILDANGFPIHPNERTTTLSRSWSPQPGFSGGYEVQWTRVVPGMPREYAFLVILDPARTGGKLFALPVPYVDWLTYQFCFRVRAFTLRPGVPFSTIDASGDAGPFSPEVCSVRPIMDGPLPPVVGSAVATSPEETRLPRVLILAGLAAISTGTLLGAVTLLGSGRRSKQFWSGRSRLP